MHNTFFALVLPILFVDFAVQFRPEFPSFSAQTHIKLFRFPLLQDEKSTNSRAPTLRWFFDTHLSVNNSCRRHFGMGFVLEIAHIYTASQCSSQGWKRKMKIAHYRNCEYVLKCVFIKKPRAQVRKLFKVSSHNLWAISQYFVIGGIWNLESPATEAPIIIEKEQPLKFKVPEYVKAFKI